ncbi:27 kDa hemolymph protein-like [Pectinophora gossypiella]|uniref:27 kDa hemolymph protein-like n=1 Tax=Pectinophora gossypiella TaxID=13191 RepID=UPI00214F53E3|nr:27 kDa hemolymph protein-like [Pectinophora gossypiella]
MIWKTILVAFLAVGAFAQYQVTDEQRQQFKSMVTQYCKKNGAEDKVEDVENAAKSFIECGKSLFDPETIKKEIEEAKPKGALDEVFKKYCAKSPQLKTCIHTLLTAVTPCLDATLREHVTSINNATDQLIDFVCYKDGDRIALFIAEGGPECFQEKANQIRECAGKVREGVPDVDAAKKLTIQEQCAKFDELSSCIVRALEGCAAPTSGNMAESLFKYVRNGTPCAKSS